MDKELSALLSVLEFALGDISKRTSDKSSRRTAKAALERIEDYKAEQHDR